MFPVLFSHNHRTPFLKLKTAFGGYILSMNIQQLVGQYVRIAFVYYGANATIVSDLRQYTSSTQAYSALRAIPYLGQGQANMAALVVILFEK
jgi:hypothetical protein